MNAPVMLMLVMMLAMAGSSYALLSTMLGRRRMAMRVRFALGGREGARPVETDLRTELRGGASQLLARLGGLMPLGDEDREKIQTSLWRANFTSNQAFAVVLGAKLLCILVGLAVGVVLGPTLLDGALGWVAGVGGGFLGGILLNLLPEFVVARAGTRRLRRVNQGLVDAFDLMIVCLEAGLTFERALRRTAEHLTFLWPELAAEMKVAVTDMGVRGVSRLDALARISDRLDSQPLRDMAVSVGQSERFGTPLADTLRKLNSSLRIAQISRMQEKAARLPTLLVVPSIACLLPGILVIVGGPAFVQLTTTLGNVGG